MNAETTIRVLVVDDEAIARRGLVRMLKEINDKASFSLEIVGEADNGQSALSLIQSLAPDVVFLDISMPGLTGLEVVDLLSNDLIQIIFVTAHEEFAIEAFDRDALDYILKPFGLSRLLKAVERTYKRLKERQSLQESVPPKEAQPLETRFLAKRDGKVCLVAVKEVIAIESDSNYALLHTEEHSFSLRATLSELEKKLDPQEFVRTHRSYIVRIDAIVEMTRTGSGDVNLRLTDGTTFPLSRTYRAEFEQRVGRIP